MKHYIAEYKCQYEPHGAYFDRILLLRAENWHDAFNQFGKEMAGREIQWAIKVNIREA